MSPPRVLTFLTHKARETDDACEDSVYPRPGEASQEFFAVADGATQSFYSRIWAQKLTSRFAEKGNDAFENWVTWLKSAREAWRKEVAAEVEKRPEDIYTINGFNERRPAAATFVGLQLLPVQTRHMVAWRALVLGDSCLFHLTSKGNVCRYPKQNAADFTFITESVESYPKTSEQKPTRLATSSVDQVGFVHTAEVLPGDAFLLATDAFSKWMIESEEAREPVWGEVGRLDHDEKFRKLVADARTDLERPLQDDDVALIVVRFGELHAVFNGQKYVAKPPARTTPELSPRQKRPLPEKAFRTPARTSLLELPPHLEKGKKSDLVLPHKKSFPAIALLLGLSLLINFGLAGIGWVLLQREDAKLNKVANDLRETKDLVKSLESSTARFAPAFAESEQGLINKFAASTSSERQLTLGLQCSP